MKLKAKAYEFPVSTLQKIFSQNFAAGSCPVAIEEINQTRVEIRKNAAWLS